MSRFLLFLFFFAICHGQAWGERQPTEKDRAFWESVTQRRKESSRHARAVDRLQELLTRGQFERLSPPHQDQLVEYMALRVDRGAVLVRCWEERTAPEVLEAFLAVETADAAEVGKELPLAEANQLGSRWSSTATGGGGLGAQGQPVTVTWSVVPDGTGIPSQPSVGDSSDPSNLRAWLTGVYGGDPAAPIESQAWFAVLQDAFENVSGKSGVTFVYEPNDDGASFPTAAGTLGVRGDVRIGAHRIDGNSGTLAYNFYPDTGDMVIDSADSFFDTPGTNPLRLRNTVEHEMLHGLGVAHVCPLDGTKLMEPYINVGFVGMQYDDIYSVQCHYGDPLEKGEASDQNDSAGDAAPLAVAPGASVEVEWLSLDGEVDADWFAFEATAGMAITTFVDPGNENYAEGPQNQNGTCSTGDEFNAAAVRDLSVRLVGPDGNTALVSKNAEVAGSPEEILRYVTADTGTHYLVVEGDTVDSLQLYFLSLDLETSGAAPVVAANSIVRESFSEPNGALDPGETIEFSVLIENRGTLEAENVTVAILGSDGFVGFTSPRQIGTLAPGATAVTSFVFGFSGSFGEPAEINLTVSEGGGSEFVTTVRFPLGIVTAIAEETFDASADLPTGWSSTTAGEGWDWSISIVAADSPPNAAFAPNRTQAGISALESPTFFPGSDGATLRFRHWYATQPGRDGGVLELSIDGGAWTDILDTSAAFTEGGYNSTLDTTRANPLPNRSAWSGDSGGFVTTGVIIPPSLAGMPIRFRWVLGHDRLIANGDGWRVDDVVFESALESSSLPLVSLAVPVDETEEFGLVGPAVLKVSAELPPIADIPVPLVFGGTANAATDVTGILGIVLPFGSAMAEFPIRAVPDSEVEGPETLILGLDPAANLVAINGGPFPIQIGDTPYGNWAASTVGVGGTTAPELDGDDDGSSNLEEHAWQTDGGDATSFPSPEFSVVGGTLRLGAPGNQTPADVTVVAETSIDLEVWTTLGVGMDGDGFTVPLSGEAMRFLRLRYMLEEGLP